MRKRWSPHPEAGWFSRARNIEVKYIYPLGLLVSVLQYYYSSPFRVVVRFSIFSGRGPWNLKKWKNGQCLRPRKEPSLCSGTSQYPGTCPSGNEQKQ
ncbi:hypothetical protein ACLB2K_029447 [Fragaria x ananassa]